jgi:sigma-54 dependent transcriptional regulator rtcR
VIDECRKHQNMAQAGRVLFHVSRNSRAKTNDSDRLRKYLQKFGLEWGDIVQ